MSSKGDGFGEFVAGVLLVGAGLVIAAKVVGGTQKAIRESAEQIAREHEARERAELRREEEEHRAERREELEQMRDDGIDVCLDCLTIEPTYNSCGHCAGCGGTCGCGCNKCPGCCDWGD